MIYDIEDNNWYFQMEKHFSFHEHNNTTRQTTGVSQSVEELHLKQAKRCRSHSSPDENQQQQQTGSSTSSGHTPPGYSEFYSLYDLTSDLIEPIPSSLVLYR